jgi:cytosol aminopeptidase
VIGVIGLGEKEKLNGHVVRSATSRAIKQIRALNPKENVTIQLDDFGFPLGAGEGAMLGTFEFDKFKKEKSGNCNVVPLKVTEKWDEGVILGKAQNMSRELMELPGNHMNPTLFTEYAQRIFFGAKDIILFVRDREWVEKQKMGAFLSVSNGSKNDVPLKFMEIHYRGGNPDDRPLALVGKGVTFDSGGISIKPSQGMAMMKVLVC